MWGSAHYNKGRLSYDAAADYLAKARNKWDRPLHGKANARIMWLGNGVRGTDSIGLRLHQTICVVLHPDGTYTINTGGWNTHITRKFINHYSPVRLHSERYQLKISDKNNSVTPPKVWKCRTCSGEGTGISRHESHGEWTYASGRHEYVKYDEPKVSFHNWSCYRCNGTGRADYGSKIVYTDWDGSWLRIDAEGDVLGDGQSWYGYSKSQPESKPKSYVLADEESATYHGVGDSLRSLLPGLSTHVNCPECGDDRHRPAFAVSSCIIHLNDQHRWTREQIADWLDTLSVDLQFPTTDLEVAA